MSSRHRPRLPIRLPGPSRGLAIGIMGGSFDPPHGGHTHVIETAKRTLGLDWVWVIPAAGNPLKRTATPFIDRMASARKRFSGPRVRVSAIERDIGSPYTIDLIRALKRRAPGARFVLLVGSDNIADLHRWRRWREIAKLVPIAAVARPRSTVRAGLSRFARTFAAARLPVQAARALAGRRAPAWVHLAAPFDETSSTAIRALMMTASVPPL
jgi:nicotinate-nucleotide adenylyltransferase